MLANLSKILELINSEIRLIKDGEFNSLSLLNGKLKKDDMLLAYIESENYIPELANNKEITCIVCKDEILDQVKDVFDGGIVVSKNPRTSFFMFHNHLNRNTEFYRKNYDTYIESSAEINNSVVIPKKNVSIGENTKIMRNVVIYENTIIGDNVIIREGSVIGSPAFYYFNHNGNNEEVDSVGGVVIKNNVTINPNVVVSRGTLGGNTEIGEYSKIDSNSIISHDVVIKENCLITGGTGIAGAVVVNKGTFIGFGTDVIPLVTIGENCYIGGGSIVVSDLADNVKAFGNPAKAYDKSK